jgi:ligand-binding sensor domain-containing protein/two-component sensor histidine kinase
MRIILYLFLLVSFFVSRVFAQDLKFLHYQLDSGLPSNTVYKVYRDSQGLLWFATDMGIASYNGKTFTKYNTFSGLPDNEIFFFQQDLNGRIWMGSFSGELSFIQNNTIHNSFNTPFLKLPFKATVNCGHISKDSSVTILFENKKFVNIHNSKVNIYSLPSQYPHAQYLAKKSAFEYEAFYVDKIITIDTSGHILKVKKFNRKYIGYTVTETGKQVKILLVSKEGIFDRNEKLVYACKLSENSFYFPRSLEKDGNFFLCTRKGLIVNNQLLMQGMAVSSITADRSGNYWISTLNNGVYCFPKNFKDISEYNLPINGAVNAVREVNGKTLFSTTLGALYKLDKIKGTIKYLGGGLERQGLINVSEIDKNGSYFVFSNAGNFYISSGAKKKIKLPYFDSIVPKKIILNNNKVYSFAISEMYCFDYSTIVNNNSDTPIILKQKERIFYWSLDNKQNVWFSTAKGLYKVLNNKTVFQDQLPHINFRNFTFRGNYLIGYNEKNDLFICNNYSGNSKIEKINKANYILEKIYLIDSAEAIISTSEHYLYIKLKHSDSQPNYEIKTIENSFIPKHVDYIYSDKEFLYFFKSNKITKIARQVLYQDAPKPSIYFSNLKADKYNIPINQVVQIPFEHARNINIKFNSISDYGNELQYEYLISNKSKSWTVSEAQELNIISPDYGEYLIKMRCKTISGQYSNTAAFKLIIGKPYWAKWWFRILILILILLLTTGLISIIVKRIINKQKKERDIEIKHSQLEFKALNALMNPHFIFNSLNNIQGLINDNNKELANKYLVVFSKVIRQNMLNLTHVTISLKKEILLVENYLQLEKLRFEHAFGYKIVVSPLINIDNIQIPPLIIQPLVENAVKHGLLKSNKDKKEVIIEVSKDLDGLLITVQDNGIGLLSKKDDSMKGHTSVGIKNITERLEYFKTYNKQIITLNIIELQDDQGTISGTLATLKIFN